MWKSPPDAGKTPDLSPVHRGEMGWCSTGLWHHSGMENLQGSIALDEIHLQGNGVPFSAIGSNCSPGAEGCLVPLSALARLQKSDGAFEEGSSFN